jgi:1,4-dihydroxy-2-naphthoyl-CoA hydrolase
MNGPDPRFYEAMPFARTLGIELLEASREIVRARLAWSEERCTTGGALHGGALMALADSSGGMCAFLNLPESAAGTTTVTSSTSFMRAVRSVYAEAASRPAHIGRTIVVIETEVRDADGRMAARCTQSQLVMHE